MKPTVYLICGVPGSGKTWVAKQLRDQFTYVPYDDHRKAGIVSALKAKRGLSPLVTECPFGESELKAELEKAGFDVRPYFITEDTETIQARYEDREGKPLDQRAVTRSKTIGARAREWGAPSGTSAQVLKMLQHVGKPGYGAALKANGLTA